MNAILLLPAPEKRSSRGIWTILSHQGGYGVDGGDFAALGAANGPEVSLTIEFVGLNPAEQARALASFPGAKRCVVAARR
jgi:hypothetical protein